MLAFLVDQMRLPSKDLVGLWAFLLLVRGYWGVKKKKVPAKSKKLRLNRTFRILQTNQEFRQPNLPRSIQSSPKPGLSEKLIGQDLQMQSNLQVQAWA